VERRMKLASAAVPAVETSESVKWPQPTFCRRDNISSEREGQESST
jgi:hypothetical protein